MAEKQVRLFGEADEGEQGEVKSKYDKAEMGVWKSQLQKSVRRGDHLKAMYYADRIASKSSWSAWHRLSVIAQEDCLSSQSVTAISELYRSFMQQRRDKRTDDKQLSWDQRRGVVAAAFLLATGPKNRIADDFLWFLDEASKPDATDELKKRLNELETIDDYAYDQHTVQGRRMGRGDRYFLTDSSKLLPTDKIDTDYRQFRAWLETALLELYDRKEGKRAVISKDDDSKKEMETD